MIIQFLSAHAAHQARLAGGKTFAYDPADDGPEVEIIRFFTRFPQATVKGFAFWERFCRFVNPNA